MRRRRSRSAPVKVPTRPFAAADRFVVAVTDRFGVVQESFVDTPFGVGDSLAGTSPRRFTGRRQDPETRLWRGTMRR